MTSQDTMVDVQERYLEGLKKYKKMGVRIRIDGREVPEEDWDRIFKVAERPDGSTGFYMADFIAAPVGTIREIRLDRIYLKEL